MHKSLNFLVDEYCEALKGVRSLKHKASERGAEGKDDVGQLSGMETSLSWTIEYMVTGYMPYYSNGPFRRLVPTDPQKVLSQYSNEVIRQRSNQEKEETILNLLDLLTEKEKKASMLVWVQHLSIREAGKIMGIPHSTVWDCCQRARKKLLDIKVEQYGVRE